MAKVEFATRTRAPFPAPAPRWAGGGPRPRPEAGNRALAEEGENGRGQTVTTGRWPKSSIQDAKPLTPGCSHRTDGDIIPFRILPDMVGSAGSAVMDETPEVIGVRASPDEPDTLQVRQIIATDGESNDDRDRSRVTGAQLPGP